MRRARLPLPRGPLTSWLVDRLAEPCHPLAGWPEAPGRPQAIADPLTDEDEALALYLCYELHYDGFVGVDESWEWEPTLLGLRRTLEDRMLAGVRALVDTGTAGGGATPARPTSAPTADDVTGALDAILGRPSRSLSGYMAREGTRAQFEEFAIHRSAYQLKEADPHTWGVPRLRGDAKAALVAIQKDEYGDGDPAQVHAHLFTRTMLTLGLSADNGAYLDRIPAVTLTTVNLVSYFGLHRRWRGALVGHLAIFEMASVGPSTNYARALSRLGVGPEAAEFYDVHVVADTLHEKVARNDMAASLARDEPEVAADIIFGAEAITAVEARFAAHLLDSWAAGRSSLREPSVTGARADRQRVAV